MKKSDRSQENVPQADSSVVGLKPTLNLFDGTMVIMGVVIGSGIFISPTGVLKYTGSPGMALIVWLLCGILSMIGAYCYTELGCMIQDSGAHYIYILTAFGPLVAFLNAWLQCMVEYPASVAVVSLTFSTYLLKAIFPACDPPQAAITLFAMLCILITTFVNCWGLKWGSRVQNSFGVAKILALIVIILTGCVQLFSGKTEHFTFENTGDHFPTIMLAFYQGLWAYDGWSRLNLMIPETKEPAKTLPRAIVISLTAVMVLYMLTNIAYFTTVSAQDMLNSSAVALLYSERIWDPLKYIMAFCVALSTFGGVNGQIMSSSRLYYAAALNKQFPAFLAMVHIDRKTPVPAIIFQCILALLYLSSSDMVKLINYIGFATWITIGLTVACVPYLRWKLPRLYRPVRVHLIWPFLFIACTLLILITSMIAALVETGICVGIILAGIPVYLFIMIKKPYSVQNAMNKFTVHIQKLLMVVSPESMTKSEN